MGLLVEGAFFVEVTFLVVEDLVAFLPDFLALVAGIMQIGCIVSG